MYGSMPVNQVTNAFPKYCCDANGRRTVMQMMGLVSIALFLMPKRQRKCCNTCSRGTVLPFAVVVVVGVSDILLSADV